MKIRSIWLPALFAFSSRISQGCSKVKRLRCWASLAVSLCLALQSGSAIECPPPKRPCDAVPCPFNEDRRSCGRDVWGVHINDPFCEAAKVKANVAARATQKLCEINEGAKKLDCERLKEQERVSCVAVDAFKDPVRATVGLLDHVADETTEIGMRALPGDLRKGVEHLTKEAIQEIEKFPVAGSLISGALRTKFPLFSRMIDRIINRSCNAPATISRLSIDPQYEIDKPGRNIAVLTTPLFKRTGLSGWSVTGCTAQADGIVVRNAQHSSDDLWTIDVRLKRLVIDGLEAPPGRSIRIEVEPGVSAHVYCERRQIKEGERVIFGGPVLTDNDLPHPFLEVHPIADFHAASDLLPEAIAAISPPPPPWPRTYTVVKGDCLAWIADRNYGFQFWTKVYFANRHGIKNPEIIYPGQILTLVQ